MRELHDSELAPVAGGVGPVVAGMALWKWGALGAGTGAFGAWVTEVTDSAPGTNWHNVRVGALAGFAGGLSGAFAGLVSPTAGALAGASTAAHTTALANTAGAISRQRERNVSDNDEEHGQIQEPEQP